MTPAADLSAPVVTKLRRFLRQGQERLEAIDALMRRLGVDSLSTADLKIEDGLKAVFDEGQHRTIEKAQKWVADLDEYARGYLPAAAAMRRGVTRHPNGRGAGELSALVDNARIAIHYADPAATGFEKDEMPQLWKRLRTLIQEDPALGGKDIGVACPCSRCTCSSPPWSTSTRC